MGYKKKAKATKRKQEKKRTGYIPALFVPAKAVYGPYIPKAIREKPLLKHIV